MGDRAFYLGAAIELFSRNASVAILRLSSIYETEPVECRPQSSYLNQLLLLSVELEPWALLEACHRAEENLGRRRRERHGPRTLDADILFYEESVIRTPRLTLPHPAIARRRSVLLPLADVAPTWRHPLLGKSAAELLNECLDDSWVELFLTELQNQR